MGALLPGSIRTLEGRTLGQSDLYRNLILPNALAGNNRRQTILDAIASEKALAEARRVAADLDPNNTAARRKQAMRDRAVAAAQAARQRADEARERMRQEQERRRQIVQQRMSDAFRDQVRERSLSLLDSISGGF